MKRKVLILFVMFILIVTAVTAVTAHAESRFDVVLNSSTPTQGKHVYDSIFIAHKPNKTSYRIGEAFDSTGLVVKGNYTENGKTLSEEIPLSSVKFEGVPTRLNRAGTVTVIVSYWEKYSEQGFIPKRLIASFDITVNDIELWATEAYIAKNPDKMVYKEGESFDPTGMKLYVKWTRKDGTTKETLESTYTLDIIPEKFTQIGDVAVMLITDPKARKNGSYESFRVYLTVKVESSGQKQSSSSDEHVNKAVSQSAKPLLDPIYTNSKQKWVTVGASQKFQMSNGTYLTGWQAIDGRRYYFDAEGVLQTGWFKVGDQWYLAYDNGWMYEGEYHGYCLDYGRWVTNDIFRNIYISGSAAYYVCGDDGYIITKDGWYDAPTGDRFYVENGYGATGWYDGYYVENGKMVRNACIDVRSDTVYGYTVFDGKGKMVTASGWFCDDNGQWYYIGQDGYGYTGWIKDQYISCGHLATGVIDGEVFDQSGRKVKPAAGLVYSNGTYYYFLEDGTLYTGWLSNGRYCRDGVIQHSGLTDMIEPDYDATYFFNKDGLVPGGWTRDVWGDWHYYTADGKIYDGWLGDMYLWKSWLIKAERKGEYIEQTIDGVKYRIDSEGHAKRIY